MPTYTVDLSGAVIRVTREGGAPAAGAVLASTIKVHEMVTIKVEEVTRREVEVEVVFPVYSQYDYLLDEVDIVEFRRWDEDGTLWTIKRTRGFGWHGTSDGFEISKAKLELSGVHRGDSRRLLGLGDHACTAAEFDGALREAREFLAGIDGIKGQ